MVLRGVSRREVNRVSREIAWYSVRKAHGGALSGHVGQLDLRRQSKHTNMYRKIESPSERLL
jgi:hypothetical protein